MSEAALDLLRAYPWPGNVRELENVIYEAMVLCETDRLEETNLPPRIAAGEGGGEGTFKRAAHRAAEGAERGLIEKALREANGNRTVAARMLGISRKTLFNKMRSLGI